MVVDTFPDVYKIHQHYTIIIKKLKKRRCERSAMSVTGTFYERTGNECILNI